MNRHHFPEKALYRAVNGAILACIGMFLPFFGIGDVTWKNILVLFLVLALLTGISLLPARGKGLCFLLAAFCLGVLAAAVGLRTSVVFLQAYLQWCMGNGIGQAQWLESFLLVQTSVVTTVSFLVQIFSEKVRFLKYILAFVCAGGMLSCLLAQISLTHMSVVFSLFYIVVIYVEWLQEHWKKSKTGSLRARILWLLPFLGIYLLLMAIMPAPETPYDWQWAKDIFNQVKESFLEMSQNLLRGGREDFDTALSGFSDDGELGGSVGDSDRQVMYLQAQSNLTTNMYLIGKVYDTFNGRQWLQEYHDDERERFVDTLETLYAVRRLDENYLRDYLIETNIRVRYENFNTGYVFAPLKTRNITGVESALGYSFEGGDLRLEERKGYGTEYDVLYYQLNLGEELFGQLLEAQKEPDEELWQIIANRYEKEIGQKITQDMLAAHRQMIYENYLDEVTPSEEVISYLSEITKDAKSDLERLQAIEREFHSYTYTRTLGALPEKVTNADEFLDYFLLEGRQGYCTYFATAFVLLARAEGFPARYVQGFCVPMAGNWEAAVVSGMAHSWPEVYIDDVGWIPFEPTPGYEGLRYTPWRVSVRKSTTFDEEELAEGGQEDVLTLISPEREAEGKPADEGSEDESGQKQLWRVLGFCILVILAGAVLALVFENLLGMFMYRRMGFEERIKVEVRRNLRMLVWLGLKREGQETLQELRERGMLMTGLTSLNFIEDYEDIVYGGKKAGEEMLEGIKKEREQLWKLIRKEKKLMYVFYRMRMLLARYW